MDLYEVTIMVITIPFGCALHVICVTNSLPSDAVMQQEITVIYAFKGREVIGCF